MKLFNRVRVATATTGQGTLTLGGVVGSNFLTLAEAGAVDGDIVTFCIEEGFDFEISTGVVGGSGTTVTRATVNNSKIAGTSGASKMELGGDAQVRFIEGAAWLNTIEARAGFFQKFPEIAPKTADYTVTAADKGAPLIANKATAITFTLPAIASATDEVYFFRNIGVGLLSLDPNAAELFESSLVSPLPIPTGMMVIVWANSGKTAWRGQVFGPTSVDIHGATSKTTPVDADEIGLVDSAASNALKKLTWANAKATLAALFLRYDTAQALTAAQQSQARSNISAAMRGQIYDLTLSNNVADATNDIDIAAGEAASTESSPVLMVLASALTKRLDAAWAVGTNQGGLDTGAIANTTYHVWLIQRSDTGVVDVLFSASATAPTMPTNYDRKRRIGSIVRAGAAILGFTHYGDRFIWKTQKNDAAGVNNPGTSAITLALTVPAGIAVRALLAICLQDQTASSSTQMWVSSLDQTDTAALQTTAFTLTTTNAAGAQSLVSARAEPMTNTSAQVRYRLNVSTTDHTVNILTDGWVDTRGR